MAITNTISTIIEGFSDGFRRAVDGAQKANDRFEKSLGSSARQLELFGKKQGDLELKSRKMAGSFASLDAAVARIGKGIKAADTPFSRFIQQNRTLGDVARDTIGFIGGLNPAIAAAVAVIGLLVAGIARAVRQGIALGDSINAVANRTKFSTEALSQLKFVVEQNESSFEALQTGLRVFNRNLGAAIQGSDEAVKLFKRLGISQEELRRSSPEELFFRSADGLKNLGSAAVQTNVGMKLLGRSSESLIPVMAQGSEALAAQRREAAELGFTISGKFAKQANEFGDNLGRLRTLGQGLSIQIAQEVVPALNSFLVTIIPLARQAVPLLAGTLSSLSFLISKLDAITNLFISTLLAWRAALSGNIREAKFYREEHEKARKTLLQSKEAFDLATEAALRQVPVLKESAEVMGEVESAIEELSKRMAKDFAELAGEPEPLAQSLVQLGEKFSQLGPRGIPGLRAIRAELVRLNAEGAKTGESFDGAIQRIDQLIRQATPLRGLVDQFGRLQDGLEGGVKAAEALAKGLLEIGSPQALAQYEALIVKLTRLAAAGDDAAERAARPLIAAEGPPITAEQRAEREQLGFQPLERGAVGAEAQLQVGPPAPREELLAARAIEREAAEFVGPPTIDEANLIAVETVAGEITVQFEEQAERLEQINGFAAGLGDALVDAALGAKGAFGDFIKSALIGFAKMIAQALILKGLLKIFGGPLGFLGFDNPTNDAFALAEGRRFGMLFTRGAMGIGSQASRNGLSTNPATAEPQSVTVSPQIIVREPGPLTSIEFTDKYVIPRMRQRLRTMGEEPFTR